LHNIAPILAQYRFHWPICANMSNIGPILRQYCLLHGPLDPLVENGVDL